MEFGRDPLYIEWGNDPALYLLSHRDAPNGKILRLPFAVQLTNASVVVAEDKDVICNFKPTASGIGLVYFQNGPSHFAYLDYFDGKVRRVEEHRLATVREMVVPRGDDILYRMESYTEPYEWLHYNSSRHKDRINATALSGETAVSFEDIDVKRQAVRSKDGTAIPLDLIYRRGIRLTNTTPTLLTWEEGLGSSEAPHFDVLRRLWLDQGGALALATLRVRGGDGSSPRVEGRNKPSGDEPSPPLTKALAAAQNRVDDLAACAQFLIRSNYTSAARLAIRGGNRDPWLLGRLALPLPRTGADDGRGIGHLRPVASRKRSD